MPHLYICLPLARVRTAQAERRWIWRNLHEGGDFLPSLFARIFFSKTVRGCAFGWAAGRKLVDFMRVLQSVDIRAGLDRWQRS